MKSNIIRLSLFSVILIAGFSGSLWLFIIGVFAYTFLYFGLEIIIIAAAIDAYFGYATDSWYMYTLSVTAVLLLAQFLKPHLAVYNQ